MRGSTAGLAEGVIAPSKDAHAMFLTFIDIMFSSIILAPAIVTYWRGTWNSMQFILPANIYQSAFSSLAIGIIGHMIFTLFQERLTKLFHPDKHRITFLLCSRAYTYIYGIICVNGWRGGWQLLDVFIPPQIVTISSVTLISVLLLTVVKGLRNISATPFAVTTDNSKEYFLVPTMFKMSSKQPGLYILDCSFSVLIIGTLVVFAWRGLWILCDLSIYPEDPSMSAFGSLIIGYGIVAITFSLQSLMRWTCERLQGIWRVAAADIFLFFSFIGTINVWRGVWNLCDIYFMPENKLLSNIITHTASFLLLALLNCSNSVLVRGVYIDAEEPNGQCVIFPVYYIRLFFQKERTKKQKRLMDALEKLDENNVSLLPEKRAGIKIPIIVKSSSNHHINVNSNNEKKALELSDILMNDAVENVNETTKLKHTSNNELNMMMAATTTIQDDNDNDNDENHLTKCEKNNTSD